MDRNDFIETREDIVQNIKTLYSYLDGEVDSEHKDWAIQRMSRGSNYVLLTLNKGKTSSKFHDELCKVVNQCLFKIAFVIISITMKPHELCHHWIFDVFQWVC